MEIKEAFDILLKKDKVNEALKLVRNNKSEVICILIEKLQYAISNVEVQQKNETDCDLECVLNLLADLEAKNAFQILIKILEFRDQNVFLGIEHMSPSFFGNILYKTASNEKEVLILENYALRQDIQGVNKLSAYYAVYAFYTIKDKNSEKLEAFNRKMVLSFNEAGYDYNDNHGLLLQVIDYSIKKKYFDLYEDIQSLLIKLIIQSSWGYNFIGFKSYFEYLYKIDPLMPAKIYNVKAYIRNLRNCTDKEIFQCDTLPDVGKYLFSKILGSVELANCEIIKITIKQLNHYPCNDRKAPCTDEQYYKEICYYLDICEVPKKKYLYAKELYKSIFGNDYLNLVQKIETLVKTTKKQKEQLRKETEKIIKKENCNRLVRKDIEGSKGKIIELHFKEKGLSALYKCENSHESGLLIYYLHELNNFFSMFCEDIDNADKVDVKLREISIKAICIHDKLIDEKFGKYKRVIAQFNHLIDESPYNTLYKIFYKIKFIPFAEKIQLGIWHKLRSDDEVKEIKLELENKINTHPLNPQSLSDCFKKDISQYCKILEGFLCESATQIRECISKSICLKKRETVIEQCLLLVEKGEDELVINLLPIQIEGLFVDLLEYSTIYEYIKDIKQYKSILSRDLVQKIDFSRGKNINLPFDAIAYFDYYFNNIVRNTVAHGNYDLLVKRGRVDEENNIDIVNIKVIKRVIALELLLDLQYLVYTISEINEIDTANRYITEVYVNYLSSNKEGAMDIFYECLFDDLSGRRNRYKLSDYKSEIFVTYDPLQLFYWIFNPYYEKYLDTEQLNKIRDMVCSLGFWSIVKEKLSAKETFRYNKFDAKKFQVIINRMFTLDLQTDVRSIIVKVNDRLRDFQK